MSQRFWARGAIKKDDDTVVPLPEGIFRSPPVTVVAVMTLVLASCTITFDDIEQVRTGSVSRATLQRISQLAMNRDAPILIRIFKEESMLEVWKRNRRGQFALLKSYPICRYSDELGPKVTEGDKQAPEGFYEVSSSQLNPWSRNHLAFDLAFPNAYDQSHGRTGSFLLVHGGCKTIGCYTMTDEQIEEVYGLAYEALKAGQKSIQVEAFPFRMTEANLSRHQHSPHLAFWSMLKEGSDAFEQTRLQAKVAVCEQRYVFNAAFRPHEVSPSAPCPVSDGPPLLAGSPSSNFDVTPTAYARDDALAKRILERLGRTQPWKSDQ